MIALARKAGDKVDIRSDGGTYEVYLRRFPFHQSGQPAPDKFLVVSYE